MSYVSTNRENNSVVLKLNTERLDAAIASNMKSEMLDCLASNSAKRVVVDLGSVTFVDSSGLGALVSVRKNIPPDHDMEIRNMNEFVGKVFTLTKMDRVFKV